jgi:hypothetical protein
MTLPAASAHRRLQHRRQIEVQVYDRGDGFWEVDALLVDTKTRDSNPGGALRPAGTPIHDMLLRLVVDERFQIVEAGAESRWVPFAGHCDAHGDTYGRLVGLNLMKGFRDALRERVGGVLGCTHITELAQVVPTAVVQAFAGEVIDTKGEGDSRPFQIGRCHAYRTDGEVVRQHYPRWYRPTVPATKAAATADSPRSPE